MSTAIHTSSATSPKTGFRLLEMYDIRTELPFQKAWPNIAMLNITGNEVGS